MKHEFKILFGILAASAVLFLMFAGRAGTPDKVRITAEDPSIGRTDAPVTIVVFGDFMCHYTKDFYEQIFPSIKERYVDSGKVKIVYKHFATEERSKIESEASLCANDQGKFWQFASLAFNRTGADEQNQTLYLTGYAEAIGLDLSEFSSCIANRVHRDDVAMDYDEGLRLKIPGTPTFFVNGLKIEGHVPVERFDEVLSKFA